MKHILSPFLLCFIFVCTISAQDSVDFGIAAKVNAQWPDYSTFNEEISEIGYPGLDNNIVEYGGSILFKTPQAFLVVDILFGSGFSRKGGESGRTCFYDHYRLQVEETLDLIDGDQWMIGPHIGVSLKYARITLSNMEEVQHPSQIAATETIGLSRISPTVELGASIQKYFDLGFLHNIEQLFIGLDGGYHLDSGEHWRIDGAVPFEESGIRQSGWYAGLNLGYIL